MEITEIYGHSLWHAYCYKKQQFVIAFGWEKIMKQIVKSIGDREIAWIMLAVAAVAIWSTWGIIS
jgi:hypothetical protein